MIINPALEFLQETLTPDESSVSVLFTSKSSAGSWQIRGQQISCMRSNWKAINKPTESDVAKCDILCVVKKPDLNIIDLARKMGKIIVYDIVDSWAQPDDGQKYTNKELARDFFARAWEQINADAYIFPTRRMQDDLGLLVKKSITIYHHHWPQIGLNPLRQKVRTLGYEGADYLGEWFPIIENICKMNDIEFVMNPTNYNDLDLVVLVRGGVHGNFLSRNYKSNVKLANAYASGTPALVHYDEMSAHDTDNGDVLFFSNSADSFERQLNRLIHDLTLRQKIHENFLDFSKQYAISHIANQYESFFQLLSNKQGQ